MYKTVEENYYTIKEIADRLKVNYRTVYRWVRAGKLPAYKFGHDWRVKEGELNDFIERHKAGEEGD